MKPAFWCTVVILGLLATSTVWADAIYKWVDKEGGGHYADRAPDKDRVEIEIYTTSWCRDAKRYFRSRGIAFKAYDMEKDRQAARRLKRYSPGGGVPVTVINAQPIMGYAPAAFARALQAS